MNIFITSLLVRVTHNHNYLFGIREPPSVGSPNALKI